MAFCARHRDQIAMTKFLLAVFTALLTACASAPPPPDWQANAFSALNAYTAAYLSGNSRVAEYEFARARQEIASTGRADLMARAELTRCATQVASLVLVLEPCTAYLALADYATPAEQAYAAFLSGQWSKLDTAQLPPHYRGLLVPTSQPLGQITDPLPRLIAASLLLQKELLTPADIALAVDTASSQGWRKPLLMWLGVQLNRAQASGDTAAAANLQRRIDLLKGW
jgi:hypothetical protein